ncbi:FAD binding domain protein [Paraphoma chrysanthemicola]|uniref:FAD binding domain protein n=1 Tax=Paraphoma chrysanthemicola TaxID=798071 RepID=A0A8K0R3H7_9PLEO|nr:FAD binding domain protein [Paraphoma chrysanthemicola]
MSFFRARFLIATGLSLIAHVAAQNTTRCRNIPSDSAWPSIDHWHTLNTTVSGRLIKTTPAGHVCHDPTYDTAACEALNATWIYPWGHFDDPSGFMSAYHQNASCNPYTPESSPCLQGNYVEYAIEVHTAADIAAGIHFAKARNIRLVIKNTGHDYLGKSTGKGALSLWMHKLKETQVLNYTSEAYSGPAMKMGAGVQAFEAYTAAHNAGLAVLGGQCITVGIAGGYTQGGGHALLSGKHGMGADQALEWEVVTTNGTLLTASPTENSDLYWALSGGGGGTYGVVVSLTARAHLDTIMGGLTLAFASPSGTIDDDVLWDAVSFFQQRALPGIVDAGAHIQWAVAGPIFFIGETSIPGATEDDMRSIMKPFTDYLTNQGLAYQMNVTSYPNFYEHADHYIGPFPYGTFYSAQIQGGAMISRSTALSNSTGPELIKRLRHIGTTSNFTVISYGFNGTIKDPSTPSNAVHTGWRELLSYFVISQQWNYNVPFSVMDEQERQLTEQIMPPLQELASGAYMNEADFRNPRWQEEFYGSNWEKLSSLKKKWDPTGILYAKTAVGSEAWEEDEEGRLCRKY